jgi:hypothetical protein
VPLGQLMFAHGQVELQLVIQIAIKLPATKQRLHSQLKCSHLLLPKSPRHKNRGYPSNTALTTPSGSLPRMDLPFDQVAVCPFSRLQVVG